LITYSRGDWQLGVSRHYFGRYDRYATRSGASATLTFTGRQIAWIAPESAARGKASVYIDENLTTTVNLGRVNAPRTLVFTHEWTNAGTHKLKIVVSGTPRHPRIDLDAIAILG
jgi:hypothetical protein